MPRPLVSIVINNYNYARFLRAAIDSALSQSYASIEVLVVDDGSTDQSRAIIDSYGDRIRPVLKKNGGQASALNTGFAQCQGGIVIFLDADDILLPHATQRVDLLRAHLVGAPEVLGEDDRRVAGQRGGARLGDRGRHDVFPLVSGFTLAWSFSVRRVL